MKFVKIIVFILVFLLLLLLFLFIGARSLYPDTIVFNIENNLPENSIKVVEKKPIKFLFFGDLMMDRSVRVNIEARGFYILDDLKKKKFLEGYDFVGVNLEGVVTNEGEHYAPVKKYDFAFPPEYAQEVVKAGFNYFALSNNHMADQGEQGIVETRENLSKLPGVYYSGSKSGEVDDDSVVIVEKKDKRIAFVSYSMMSGRINDLVRNEKIEKQVEEVKSKVDFVVVNIHWGVEYQENFNEWQQALGYKMIDKGADVVIGHHPHVRQGVEVYEGKPIFYSLGNFVFDQYFSRETQRSYAVEITWLDDNIEFVLHPLKGENSKAILLEGEEKEEGLREIRERSEE